MKQPILKICGLMRAQDVALCIALRVDILGFVTEYPLPVPWNLTRQEAHARMAEVHSRAKTCMVTGGQVDRVVALALELRPDYVQLHFHETLEDTRQIVKALAPYSIGVIKTIPADSGERLAQFGDARPEQCAVMLERAGVAAVLVDSRAPGNAGESGRPADLELYHRVRSAVAIPVVLAGGITPENGEALLRHTQPQWIDVMTGVESSPGCKDARRLRALVRLVRGCCLEESEG